MPIKNINETIQKIQWNNTVSQTEQVPVNPTVPTSPAPVQNTPVDTGKPINKITWKPAWQNNPQQPVQSNPQPVDNQQYTTTNPNATLNDSVVFWEQAKQKNTLDASYLDKRDSVIADQIVNQLNSHTQSWQYVDWSTYDTVLQNIIKQNGWVVDYNSPDWLNTVDRINNKILKNTWAKTINDVYSNINKPLSNVNKYQTWDDLYTAVNNGQISKTQMDLLKSQRPDLYQQYRDKLETENTLAIVNSKNISSASIVDDYNIDVDALFTKFWLDKTSTTDIDLMSKRMELMSTWTLNASQNAYLKTKWEYTKLQDTLINIENEVRKQYEWTWATESYIQAQVSKRQRELQPKVQELQRDMLIKQEDYNLEVWQLNDTMSSYKDQISLDKQDQQLAMQKFGIAYGAMQAEQDRKDKLKLADIQFSQEIYSQKLKRDMENWDANSKDPTVKKIWIQKWVEQLMAQYDWLIQSSRDMLVGRIESDMQAGKTYGESLAWIMNEIKGKPEYKMYMSTKAWFDYTPKSMWGGLLWLPDGKWGGKVVTEDSYKQTLTPWYSSQINQAIQQERAMSGMSQYDNYDFAQQILSWQITTRTGTVCLPGMVWGQCGAFVNDMMWVAWFMGNTIESKINRTKDPQRYSPVPVVWWAIVIDRGTEYWHTGIVTAVNKDWTIDYVDSNGKAWKEKIWVNKSINVWNNMYFTRAKDKQTPSVSTTWASSTWFDTNLSWLYNKSNQWKLTKEDFAQIQSMWYDTKSFITQASEYKKNQIQLWNTEVMGAIDYLVNNYPWRTLAMSSDTWVWKFASSKLADFNSNFNLIRSKLSMDALVSLKDQGATFWALSDSERVAIWDSISALQLSNSEEEFKNNLNKAREILLRASWWKKTQQVVQQKSNLSTMFWTVWSSMVKQWLSSFVLPF